MNKDLGNNGFSENTKTSLVSPSYKKTDRYKTQNYRPMIILAKMVFEKSINDI